MLFWSKLKYDMSINIIRQHVSQYQTSSKFHELNAIV